MSKSFLDLEQEYVAHSRSLHKDGGAPLKAFRDLVAGKLRKLEPPRRNTIGGVWNLQWKVDSDRVSAGHVRHIDHAVALKLSRPDVESRLSGAFRHWPS